VASEGPEPSEGWPVWLEQALAAPSRAASVRVVVGWSLKAKEHLTWHFALSGTPTKTAFGFGPVQKNVRKVALAEPRRKKHNRAT
jgi:hypothetical protein